MPIKNKPGFVPSTAKYQPDKYTEFFSRVAAVYTHPTTKATIYLEVDADTWNHADPQDACGDLSVSYQADCRMPIGHHKNLRDALSQIDRIMSNPEFGSNLNPKPVHREIGGPFWPNKNLLKFEKRFRRKGNGKPFRLSDSDREVLSKLGYTENDFWQIELAANRATFVLEHKTPINVHEAYELLGQKTFLSGIGRAAFHWTSGRETKDDKDVSIDASVIFRQK